MKIIRIVPFLDFGGVEQRVKLTALGFQDIPEVELSILVLGQGGKVSDELEQVGIRPLILNSRIRIPNLKLVYGLYRIIKDHRPDVVHCSGSEANFHGLIAAKMAGVGHTIGEEIGFPNHGLVWRIVFKIVYSLTDRVIAISQAVADRIVAMEEVPAAKVNVVYNPVELPLDSGSQSLHARSERFVFITVCRLVPIKNLATLLKSFQQLALEMGPGRLTLHIVGDGPEKADLMLLCKDLNVGESVRFLGFQEKVAPFLQEADAFVLPSLSEGFSIALVEAMLCGLPVIATKIGGPSEIVKEGKSGFLIDPRSIEELRTAMWKLYAMNGDERKLMGAFARQEAARFSIKSHVRELMEIYHQ